MDTKKIKPFVLPAAIVFGLLLHDFCAVLAPAVPYVIFAILILTFSTTDLRRLRFERLDLWLLCAQVVGTIALYLIFSLCGGDRAIAQGMMLGALCPVASSVTVVASMLGARRENTIAYTIIGNLLVCVFAPIVFVVINGDMATNALVSFLQILWRITLAIGMPFFIMLTIQHFAHPVSDKLKVWSGLSFYLWALALLLTLGQTIDFIFMHGQGHWYVIIILAIGALVICPAQFLIGRRIGRRCGDAIAGQQLLAQKNSAMGIWMANTYLNPLASTFLAFYSIAQNLINSWQLWHKSQKSSQKCRVG